MKKAIVLFCACILMFICTAQAKETYTPVKEATFRNHTYQLFDESLSWHEARDYCVAIGGYLATITSQEEQNALEALLTSGTKKQYWLGGTETNNRGTWHWITDEEWTYNNWAGLSKPPNNDTIYMQILRVHGAGLFSYPYKWISTDAYNDISETSDLPYVGFLCEFGEPFTPGETYFGSTVSKWALFEAEKAYEMGLLPETIVGKDLTKKITRAEFAALSVLLYEELSGKYAFATTSPFSDIDNDPNATYIKTAYKLGITIGVSDTIFDPNASIWREQLAAMLCRTIKKYRFPEWSMEADADYPLDISGTTEYIDHSEISAYAIPSVYYLTKHGIINGLLPSLFSPKKTSTQAYSENLGTATREQAIAMALRIVQNKNIFK